MNNELERIWKEAVSQIQGTIPILTWRSDENHENPVRIAGPWTKI
jgi:hypothetical protein